MIDSDQSYLLKSYNQNQQLFANTDQIYQTGKINKNIKNDNHINNKIGRKRRNSSYDSFGEQSIRVSGSNVQLNVKMLDSIWEDFREEEKTGRKIKLTDRKIGFFQVQLQKQRKQYAYNDKATQRLQPNSKINRQAEQNILNTYNSKLIKAKNVFQEQSKKTKPSNTLNNNNSQTFLQINNKLSSQQSEIIQQQQFQYFQKFITKYSKQTPQKFESLTQILTQFYSQYSKLIRKLQQYENIVHNLQQIITTQNKYIINYNKQYQHLSKRIQKIVQYPINIIYGTIYTQFQQSINKINEQIKQTINNHNNVNKKNNLYQQSMMQNNINTNDKYNNKNVNIKNNMINYVQPIINYTKSVPNFSNIIPNKQITNQQSKIKQNSINNQNIKYQYQQQQSPQQNEYKQYTKQNNNNKLVTQQNNNVQQTKINKQNTIHITSFNIPLQTQTQIQHQPYFIKQQYQINTNTKYNNSNINNNKNINNNISNNNIDNSNINQIQIQSNISQNNDNYRKIANFRIKQLQKQNTNLVNQLNSMNVKVMVIKNQNKQLRQIVQGLINQIQNLNDRNNISLDLNDNVEGNYIKIFKKK